MANYEIVKKIAVLGGKPDGVTKETNIVKWGVYDPMIDIRRWQRDIASKGVSLKREDIRKYFPKSYTDKQVCDMVIKLLEQWQRRREQDRDAR